MLSKSFPHLSAMLAYSTLITASLMGFARADDEYRWSNGGKNDNKSVYYGLSETGNVWLIASCKGSNRVSLSLFIEREFENKIQRIDNIRILTVSVGSNHYPLTGDVVEDELNDGYLFETSEALDGRLMTDLSSATASQLRFGLVGIPLNPASARNFQRMNKACKGQPNQAEERARSLVHRWSNENSKCKGSWQLPGTRRACDEREKTAGHLHRIGWCYGKITDTAQYDAKWHRCERNSIRQDVKTQ